MLFRVGSLRALCLVWGDVKAFPEIPKSEVVFSHGLCLYRWNKTMHVLLPSSLPKPHSLFSYLV